MRSTFCAWPRARRVSSAASETMPEMRGETSSTRSWTRERIGVSRAFRSVNGLLNARGSAAKLEKQDDQNNRLQDHGKRRHHHEKRHPAFHAFASTRLLRFGFLPLIGFAAGIDRSGNGFLLARCDLLLRSTKSSARSRSSCALRCAYSRPSSAFFDRNSRVSSPDFGANKIPTRRRFPDPPGRN